MKYKLKFYFSLKLDESGNSDTIENRIKLEMNTFDGRLSELPEG